ncbi:MAG TPA: biotin/lipoyl-containing protein [Longimicrobiales bacterium]|nr:biotin/lipoyl-containing protein [Longimicrobiales bacterium]
MRYYVTIGDRTVEVDLTGPRPRVDGVEVEADLVALPGTPVRHLLLDGRSYALVARAGEARGAWDVHLDGRRFAPEVVDERTRAIRAMTGKGAVAQGPRPVRAPMPGLVTRVDVAVGQAVQAGQGVLVIEAMKMQNELRADAGGTVVRILVEAGQAVEKGAVLVEFEAATSPAEP